MPTDPKWRVIARRSGRPVSEVLAVFLHMMTSAGANAQNSFANATERSERGELKNWSDEDVAAAIDIEEHNVAAIRDAMQGKVLGGNKLIGWEKRQPLREDNSAERGKAWRERNRTQKNAPERPDADADADKKVPPKPPRGAGRNVKFRSRRRDRENDFRAALAKFQ
jgi:hypothetical protein